MLSPALSIIFSEIMVANVISKMGSGGEAGMCKNGGRINGGPITRKIMNIFGFKNSIETNKNDGYFWFRKWH